MNFPDILIAVRWWIYLFAIGLLFLPISRKFFGNFFDKGYIFSKTIGILIIAYIVFLLGSLHLAEFNRINIFLVMIISSLITSYLLFLPIKNIKINFNLLIKDYRKKIKLLILEEVIFILVFLGWTIIRSFQPDIHGIEKFMDFSIINSILRANFFPIQDPWLSPFSINYYYFGHILSAVIMKLSSIPSNIGFNLMISTIFALIFMNSFSILTSLANNLFKENKLRINKLIYLKIISAGLLTGAITTLGGNLQVLYAFFKSTGDNVLPLWKMTFSPTTFPNNYWYPSATRFIHHTIHEFPSYALILSDLHAHLLDTPFSLLFLGLMLSIFMKYKDQFKNKEKLYLNYNYLLFAALILGAMYMTNSWDSIIFFVLSCFIFGYIILIRKISPKSKLLSFLRYVASLSMMSIIFSLPFSLFFKPFISGIGINCSPNILLKMGKIGPLIFERGYCQNTHFWQFFILYGLFIFFGITFILFISKTKKINLSDKFIAILFIVAGLLILIPEAIYLKDIYPSFFRANTMFKISYSSFVILSIASVFIFFRIVQIKIYKNIKSIILRLIFFSISVSLIIFVFLYSFLAINSNYNNLSRSKGLDGTKYLRSTHPGDYDAINWINKNIKGTGGILEANGDSYSDFGRISANTGLSNIINWTAHEWLWRGNYDSLAPRIKDVNTLYTTQNLDMASKLLKKYKISYVYIGDMERKKYPNININKFNKIGNIIYQNKNVTIYKII